MQEIVEQIINAIRGIWRYRWYAMAVTWLVVLAGWATVFRMPAVYEATAKVYIDTESVLRPLLQGLAIRPDITQRLEMINRTILSRPNLEKLVRMADLDIQARGAADMEVLISQLSQDIHFSTSRRHNLYSISYRNSRPEVAKTVVQALVTILVESTLGESQKDSDTAQDFLVKKIEEYEQRLQEAEDRIKEFKKRNVGMMPSEGRGYFERLQAALSELAAARLQLDEAVNRRDELKRQMAGEEPVYGFGKHTVVVTTQARHPLDARIQSLRDQLNELLLRYTDEHPSVKSITSTLAELEKQREEDLKDIPMSTFTESALEQNPVYQQLKIALGQAEANVASLSVRVQEYEKRVEDLKKMVDTIPEVEAQLKSMNRDYEITKKNYDALVARLESARLSEQAGKAGEGFTVRIIEPPRLPLAPIGLSRTLLASSVLGGGLVSGLLLAFFMSQLRPVIFDRRTLSNITGLPVYGTVSILLTRNIRNKRRWNFVAFAGAGGMLLVAYLGVVFSLGRAIDLSDPAHVLQLMRSIL